MASRHGRTRDAKLPWRRYEQSKAIIRRSNATGPRGISRSQRVVVALDVVRKVNRLKRKPSGRERVGRVPEPTSDDRTVPGCQSDR
jgi:hypothetical protein